MDISKTETRGIVSLLALLVSDNERTWELQWLIIWILSNICNCCDAFNELSSLRSFWNRLNQKCLLLNIAYIQNSRDCTNIFLPVHRLRSAKYRKIDKVRSILQIRGDKSTTVVLFFQGEQLDSSAAKLRTPFMITQSFYDNICHNFDWSRLLLPLSSSLLSAKSFSSGQTI